MIEIDETQIKHMSYSAVSTWFFCPRRWYVGYVKQIKEPPNPNYTFGTAVHRAIENSAKVGSKAVDIFERELKLETAIAPMPKWQEDDLLRTGKIALGSPATQAILAGIKPAAIEMFIKFEVDGVPIPIIGFIDILQSNGIPLDIKTSRSDWTEEHAKNETQPLYYLTALDANGMHSHRGFFEHLIIVKDPVAPRSYIIRSQHENYDAIVRSAVRECWAGISERRWEQITPENHNPKCNCHTLVPWEVDL